MKKYAKKMLLIALVFFVGLILTAPVFCVASSSTGSTCSSVIGIPATIALPLVALIGVVGLGAMIYVDRHD